MNNLIKGFNTALITYGLTDRGKTHSMFGTDSTYNETNDSLNVLSTVYKEVKRHLPSLGISLNFVELTYNDEDQIENVVDLLDFSAGRESLTASYDFQGFTTVVVRSLNEFENLLKIAQMRSQNWLVTRDAVNSLETNGSGEHSSLEYRNNVSHFICRLNFTNISEKKQFSFYLVDLIGFNDKEKDTLAQISLGHINKFIDELALHKERVDAFKLTKLKTMKFFSVKSGNYSALASQNMKIVGFVANILFNSQTFFFVPLRKNAELYEESYQLFEKCFKLSTVRYSIEKEAVDTTRKINIMSYQLFTKAADTSASMNESYEKKTLNFSTQQSHEAIESGNPPFLTNQISPISKPPLNKKEIYIQDDSHGETPSKFDRSGSVEQGTQLARLKTAAENSLRRIDTLQEQVENIRKGSGDSGEYVISASSQTPKGSTFGASPKSQFSPRVQFDTGVSPMNRERTPVNKDNYYADYQQRARDLMKVIDNFMVAEIHTLKKDNLPGEYYVLRKHFDMLYRLFKEGEEVKANLTNDFAELGKKIQEFKEGYDQKLQEANAEYLALQNKFSLAIEQSNLKDLFDLYERDIDNLTKENEYLKGENLRLLNELNRYIQNEGRGGYSAEYNSVLKKYNHLTKQYDKLTRQMNDKEAEMAYLRKRERLFTVEKKMIETVQQKNLSIAHKLENKEEINRGLSEQLKFLEKENNKLKEKVKDLEAELNKVTQDYYGALEKASLFKEMAKAPTEQFLKSYKEVKENAPQTPKDSNIRRTPSKKMEEIDRMVSKLKSLN